MKAINLAYLAAGVGAYVALAACGGSSGSMMTMTPPPPSMTPPPTPPPMQAVPMDYLTADILAKARVSSETDDPVAVNAGLVELSPSNDQTSDPMAVDVD